MDQGGEMRSFGRRRKGSRTFISKEEGKRKPHENNERMTERERERHRKKEKERERKERERDTRKKGEEIYAKKTTVFVFSRGTLRVCVERRLKVILPFFTSFPNTSRP